MENEWHITDPDSNQMYQVIVEDEVLRFREDRLINPDTGETEVYESDMDIKEYDWWEIVQACEAFGYSAKQVDDWLNTGEEIPLILECLFEQEIN